MTLVLEQRYSRPLDLPALNKWQLRQCAKCGVTQSTGAHWAVVGTVVDAVFRRRVVGLSWRDRLRVDDGGADCSACCAGMFGVKAHYCAYTELLFCTECFGNESRQLPWRVVQSLDTTPRRYVEARSWRFAYALAANMCMNVCSPSGCLPSLPSSWTVFSICRL